jgi:uncharacterized damage-inducible protein DinB
MRSGRRRPSPGESWSAFLPTNSRGNLTPNRCRSANWPCTSKLAQQEGLDTSQANFDPPPPGDAKQILTAFEASIKATEENLGGLSESTAVGNWRLTSKRKEVFTVPRVGLLRTIMLNHWYHHRGQLSVYLRLLEVPVPVIYGRSADENPFA